MLKLLNLSRSFGEKEVLRGLTFNFPEKGVFALMGPSGAGKTTLLRLLAGLDQPNDGKILSTHEQVAVAFQEPRLLPWLTCRDNLTLVLGDQENATQTAEKWLELMELNDVADEFPAALSGGMQQRLSLSRALCYGGDLFLFDEPFSALDQSLKERIAPVIQKATEHALVIMITHDKRDAELLGATILWCDGEPISALSDEVKK